MIILNMPQGSLEWILARLWRLTASEMKTNVTSTGTLSRSKAAIKSIDKLIAGIELANEMNSKADEFSEMKDWEIERFMAHYTGQKFSGSVHTERGHDFEADAIAAMSEIVGNQIQDVGMCLMGDDKNSVVSCSPDGRVMAGGKMVAGAEVKSPCLCNYYGHVADDIFPDDYKMQVHASMAICEVDSWHFGSYFHGKPLFYKEMKRDAFTDKLAATLEEFAVMYAERYEVVTSGVAKLDEAKQEGGLIC